jgi:hypothetical protein
MVTCIPIDGKVDPSKIFLPAAPLALCRGHPCMGSAPAGGGSLGTSLQTVCQMQQTLRIHELWVCHFMAQEQKFAKLIATEKVMNSKP